VLDAVFTEDTTLAAAELPFIGIMIPQNEKTSTRWYENRKDN
jgi:hypothetical protein